MESGSLVMASESLVMVSEQISECATSSSQNSVTGVLSPSSSQNSLTGGEVAGSSQNPMPGGASCASVDFLGSDLDCGEVAGFSSSIGESQERDKSLTKGLRGGYTCCVPGCYKNTK